MPKKIIKKSVLSPTVLIAGGAGFIGAHLAEALLEQKVNVVVIDNLNIAGKEIHIDALLKNENFAFFDVDINKGLPVEIESVDYVFHLTGVETYMYSDGWGLETLLANSLGTKNLLDFAQNCGAKFLLASSTDVYQGMLSSQNLIHYFGKTEFEERKYSLIEAKRYAEALVWEYYKKFDLDARIVRIPKVYGPRMPLSSTDDLNIAIKDLLEDRNLRLHGEGTEKNYYLYITDTVSGIIKAIFSEGTKGNIYSLVAHEPYTSLEVIYLLKSLANRELNVEFKPKSGEITHRFVEPDTSNLKELSWDAKMEFKEGLINTLKWFGYETNEHSFKPTKIIEDKKVSDKKADSIIPVATQTIVPKQAQTQTVPLEKKATSQKKVSGKPALKKLGTILKFFAPVLFIAIALVGVPFGQTYYYSTKAVAYLESVEGDITKLDFESAQSNANAAYLNFQKAQNALRMTSWAFKSTGNDEMYNALQNSLDSTESFSKAIYFGTKAASPFSDIWSVLRLDMEERITAKQLADLSFYMGTAKSNLTLANAIAQEIDEEALPAGMQEYVAQYKTTLKLASDKLPLVEAATKNLEEILGVEAPKKYLILFQNSNELRPTGGFIGSYAVLELEEGKIKNLKIDDIYNPDGQLDIKEFENKSAEQIEVLLGEPNTHIRNANWNPDFKETTKEIEELFYLVDGSTFDGVIAVDLAFVRNLLEITGPVFLTAYNEEVSAGNLYEKTQFYSEFNYKEGESQKRAFLTVLGSKLLEKTFAMPREKTREVGEMLRQSLAERHLLINLKNAQFNNVLEENGWNGTLTKTDGDYLYVVNSNMGGNKANYFVEDKMAYEVASLTRDGVLRGKVSVEYKHNGKDNAWPGGEYVNYVRILTQAGTKLTAARVEIYENGKMVDLEDATQTSTTAAETVAIKPLLTPNATITTETLEKYAELEENPADIFENVTTEKLGRYTSYGMLLRIKPKQTVKLFIEYDLPQKLAVTNNRQTYNLFWQKQPGTENAPFAFKFSTPLGKDVKSGIVLGADTGFDGSGKNQAKDKGNFEYKGTLDRNARIHIGY